MRGRVISPDVREDPAGTLSLLARQGYDLIVVELSYSDALAAVAPRFPKARFALFDAPLDWLGGVSKSNVQAVVLQPLQAAYLAGWLAARLEQRRSGKDVVGAVGGIDIPPVNDFIVGFRAGARSADPGISVLTGYSDDFLDANKCEAIARSQIARGAGTVFNVAGLCGLGTLRAAKDAGVWGIGVDTDQSFLGASHPHQRPEELRRRVPRADAAGAQRQDSHRSHDSAHAPPGRCGSRARQSEGAGFAARRARPAPSADRRG